MLRASQFNTFLQPVIYHHIELGISSVPQYRGNLFNVQKSSLSEEKGTSIGGISPDAWDAYKKSGKKGRLNFSQLFTQTYTHEEYPVELVVEKKLLQFDQTGKIKSYLRRAGLNAAIKKEIDAASLLNNAFNTDFTFGDGKPLCSATHPASPHDASTVYSNTGTLALTAENLSAERVTMMRTKDDKGVEIGLMANEIWCSPELEDTAIIATRSDKDPSSGNNATNPQTGRWTVKPWLRLSDPNAWFIMDGTWRQELVNWYDVNEMEIMLVHESTTELVYEIKLFYSFGVDDWRFVRGNNPS
jgi:hypothetical protein